MNKYISIIVIFTLIIIIYFCNNIENFTSSTNPSVTEPVVTDPVVTDPVVTDPVVTDPVVTDPVVTDPVVTDPVVTDPVVTDPVVNDPVVTDPVVTDSEPKVPVSTAPPILRKPYNKDTLNEYMDKIEKSLSSVLSLTKSKLYR